MVTWTANGQAVVLRRDGGVFVISGAGPTDGAHGIHDALARVRNRLHHILGHAHGPTGWSLSVAFGGVTAVWGDARIGGGRGGQVSDELLCVRQYHHMARNPHDAVQNSIEIVEHCWSGT